MIRMRMMLSVGLVSVNLYPTDDEGELPVTIDEGRAGRRVRVRIQVRVDATGHFIPGAKGGVEQVFEAADELAVRPGLQEPRNGEVTIRIILGRFR
jgi:hypothetical protein